MENSSLVANLKLVLVPARGHMQVVSNARLFSSAALVLFVAACANGDQGTGRTSEMRCATDGLCIEQVGTKSVELGYREGGHEVRVDSIYRRHGSQLKSGRPFSVRLIDPSGTVFSLSNSGSNPDGWLSQNAGSSVDKGSSRQDTARVLEARNSLLPKMLQAMADVGKPEGIDKDAWEEAAEHLEHFVSLLLKPRLSFHVDEAADSLEEVSSFEGETQGLDFESLREEGSEDEDEAAANDDAMDELEAHAEVELAPGEQPSRLTSWRDPRSYVSFFGSVDGLKKKAHRLRGSL